MLRTKNNPVESVPKVNRRDACHADHDTKPAHKIWVLIELGWSGSGDMLRQGSSCFGQHALQADSLCSCHG